jgi:hypothetical protein
MVLALRAARAWQVPPMTYLREWSSRDRGLAEGLLLYEQGTGPHGFPMRYATDDDNDGWFEVVERTDYAQAAIDQWREGLKGRHVPGVFPVVIDTRGRDLDD